MTFMIFYEMSEYIIIIIYLFVYTVIKSFLVLLIALGKIFFFNDSFNILIHWLETRLEVALKDMKLDLRLDLKDVLQRTISQQR